MHVQKMNCCPSTAAYHCHDSKGESCYGKDPLIKDDTEGDSGTNTDSDDSSQSSQPTTAARWDVY